MKRYDHNAIEKKWQAYWESAHYGSAREGEGKKTYLLIEFPYPSGAGLHTGHVRSYTALDVIARKRRSQGENVLYPIGWDAFGLPTENYAIKTGRNPVEITKENTDTYRAQLKKLAISFDWSREINTTDPSYYKWTQWIFLQLYKHGLAYKAKTLINWCPKCKIGLANEEVVNNACERCGHAPVEKREKEQWMLTITKYAQRLYDDLDTVDYIERAKVQQRNWIGPSEGALIRFALSEKETGAGGRTPESVEVFTTRPDTIFGATFLAISAEKAQEWIDGGWVARADAVQYIAETIRSRHAAGREETPEKTGIFSGVYAVNPATQEEVPVWITNYVLGDVGTGAIMAVPAHDERDYDFAKKYDLPIREVIMPTLIDESNPPQEGKPEIVRNNVLAVVMNPRTGKYLALQWKEQPWTTFVMGGVDEGEDAVEAAKREIAEETGYTDVVFKRRLGGPVQTKYFAAHKGENRKAVGQCLYFELASDAQQEIAEQERALHEVVWLERVDIVPGKLAHAELPLISEHLDSSDAVYTGEGILINSGDFTGLTSSEAKKKITDTLGGTWTTTFKLRDWVFSRQRYWGEPIPMVHCEQCGWVPLPEDQLPLTLPAVEKYEPTDTGESPLANISEWVNTTCPQCEGPATRETDVMPNWAGSSWYFLRYTDPHNDTTFADPEKLKYWTPVDWYNGGMEHTVLHLLYSRFWHKFLFDIGAVPTPEPYQKRTSHGLILAEDGEKMSKSKGNVVNPDDIVASVGADTLRLYEMFMGPFDQAIAWSTDNMVGVRRFIEKVWRLQEKVESEASVRENIDRLMHATIDKVSRDIEELKMNTAVSQLMIFYNALEKEAAVPRAAYHTLLKLLAPFAPHVTAELWEMTGGAGDIHSEPWPVADAQKLATGDVTIAVQVNGKTRGTIRAPRGLSEGDAAQKAGAETRVAAALEGKKVAKTIYVPDRLINFVTEAGSP